VNCSSKRLVTPSAVAAAIAAEFGLTTREGQVLRYAADGKSIKEIAVEVGVSARSIEYFWRRIFAKLGCSSQLHVMALLLRRACCRPGARHVRPDSANEDA
jgi:DNA-binding CsgD family transcriptional regulator